MRTELPVCKRCCFCLPLRYGLITWGYIKLIAATILSITLIITLYNIVQVMIQYKYPYHVHHVVVISIVLVILLTDVGLNTLFIVGGHTKNVKLLRVYYIYNIVQWGLTIALVLVMAFLMVPVDPDRVISYHTWLMLLDLSSSFVNILMQSYFLLLLRSEIIKLRNNCEFRFVNNAAEAECIMKYKEGRADEEKGTEDDREKERCETEDVCEITCHTNGKCHKNEDQN